MCPNRVAESMVCSAFETFLIGCMVRSSVSAAPKAVAGTEILTEIVGTAGAASSALSLKNIGPCGAKGPWGAVRGERIFYMKTIKTASSTTMELFENFALRHKLNAIKDARTGHGNMIDDATFGPNWKQSMIAWMKDRIFDISYIHSSYDRAAIAKYLPNARLFTISREPVSRFISACNMFLGSGPDDVVARKSIDMKFQHRVFNSVAFQFGQPEAREQALQIQDVARAEKAFAAANMDRILASVEGPMRFYTSPHDEDIPGGFDLVMITERLDESYMVLRSMLCWSFLDLLTRSMPLSLPDQDHRSRAHEYHDTLSEVGRSKVLSLNALDVRIHEAALRAFNETVSTRYPGGQESLSRDVLLFKRFKHLHSAACLACCEGDKPLLNPTGKPVRSLAAIDCSAVRESCSVMMLRSTIKHCHSGSSGGAYAAEDTIFASLHACNGTFQEVAVCPMHHEDMCATGELCLQQGETSLKRIFL